MQGNEEAQAVFVTNGTLDMLLTRTLQHTHNLQAAAATAAAAAATPAAAGSSVTDASGPAGLSKPTRASSGNGVGGAGHQLLLQLLVFLQLLLGGVIGEAVKKGE